MQSLVFETCASCEKSESYFDKNIHFWIIIIQNIDLAVTKNMMIN